MIPKSWNQGIFRCHKGKKYHYVVCPNGEKIALGFNADEQEDKAQAEFIAHACNTALMAFSTGKKASPCPRCNGTGEISELAGHNVSDCVIYPCPECS